MARVLSIDYGKKRTGIAVTDSLQIIANGLVTVATPDLMTFLLQYWFVSRLGYPETFATTCQNYTGEFLYEARCEYT